MAKYLVTGATGFIGNYVVQALLQKNCEVVATSVHQQKAALTNWFEAVTYIPFNFLHFDDTINYQNYFGNPDGVIHLAWEGLPNYKDDFHLTQNLPKHFSFLKNLVLNGQQNITITGTCLEYGLQEGCLTESMPAVPIVPYAAAKNQLRVLLEELQSQKSFLLKWMRLFYMYGDGQNKNALLPQLQNALQNGDSIFNMSNGQQTRDYLHVADVAKYIVEASIQQQITGIINCSNGVGIKVIDFVQNYLAANQKEIKLNLGYYPYPDYEPLDFWGSNNLLQKIIKG